MNEMPSHTSVSRAGVAAGACVLIVLREPREQCWGRLDEINTVGVFLRGLDVHAFEDWTRGAARGENDIAPSDFFFPLWRVERITRDESTASVISLSQQFEQRTGLNVHAALDAPATMYADVNEDDNDVV